MASLTSPITTIEILRLTAACDVAYRWPDHTCMELPRKLLQFLGHEAPAHDIENWSERSAYKHVRRYYNGRWWPVAFRYLFDIDAAEGHLVKRPQTGDVMEVKHQLTATERRSAITHSNYHLGIVMDNSFLMRDRHGYYPIPIDKLEVMNCLSLKVKKENK